MDLEGRVAIVTGGARGIGRGIAIELARAGCDVTIGDLLDRDEVAAAAEDTLAQIEATGREGRAVRCDVTQEADCDALVAQAIFDWGGLDIVVCNAGVLAKSPVVETSTEDWERVMQVNATGTFQTCRAALPHLKARGSGSIVNIASVAGLHAHGGRAQYTSSKFAVVGFTQSLAAEVAKDGVRVNCVCPSSVRSQMTLGELSEYTGIDDPAKADALWSKVASKRLPLGRSVEPADIGQAVVYLCQADMVVGVALPVTGGDGMPAE
jgi:meso-butanediol dehydrogenase/(S,S)-butanediol dehydrogenase/diacetyl reductase